MSEVSPFAAFDGILYGRVQSVNGTSPGPLAQLSYNCRFYTASGFLDVPSVTPSQRPDPNIPHFGGVEWYAAPIGNLVVAIRQGEEWDFQFGMSEFPKLFLCE